MTATDEFSLVRQRSADGETPDQAPRAAVLRRGQPMGLTIDGATLEAQFTVNTDRYLLLVSDDCPYEETLHVYLLNADGKLMESARLAYAYTAGILRDLQVAENHVLEFTFTGSLRYRLQVHDRPRRFWNASGGVCEIVRILSKRYLEITRKVIDA